MPTYEYRCTQCRRKSSRFFRSISQVTDVSCPHCGGADMARVPSSFAVHTPWDSGMNIPSFESMSDFDEDDPASVSKWTEGMRRDMGDEFGREFEAEISSMDDSDY